jgi:tetratricopeptide (TPR) repeat protein
MFVFEMLAGAALGIRLNASSRGNRTFAVSALVLGGLAWLAAAVGIAAPVAIAERAAQRGDDAIRAGSPAVAVLEFRRASDGVWVPNGDYAYRAARATILAGHPPDHVRATLQTAIDRSPMNPAYPRLLAEYELRQSSPNQRAIIAAYQRVISLDPNDVSAHLDFARALERFGRNDEARREYEEALRLNDLMDPAEPERLPQVKIDEIRAAVGRLR